MSQCELTVVSAYTHKQYHQCVYLPGVPHSSFSDNYQRLPASPKHASSPREPSPGLFLPKKLFQKRNPPPSSICLGRSQKITLAFISTLRVSPGTPNTQKEAEPHPSVSPHRQRGGRVPFPAPPQSFPQLSQEAGGRSAGKTRSMQGHSQLAHLLPKQPGSGLPLRKAESPTGPGLPTCLHTHSQPLLFRGSHGVFLCPRTPTSWARGYC